MRRGDPRLPPSAEIGTTGLSEWARRLIVRLHDRFRHIDEDMVDAYGEMYAENVAYTVTIAGANTWTVVDGGMTAGTCTAFTFQNSSELACNRAGRYMVWWSLSLETTGANDDIEASVGVNGTQQSNMICHDFVVTPNEEFAVASHGIVLLALGDIVTLMVNNNTDADDLVVEHANLTLLMLKD